MFAAGRSSAPSSSALTAAASSLPCFFLALNAAALTPVPQRRFLHSASMLPPLNCPYCPRPSIRSQTKILRPPASPPPLIPEFLTILVRASRTSFYPRALSDSFVPRVFALQTQTYEASRKKSEWLPTFISVTPFSRERASTQRCPGQSP
jgi:hypothetical protein